MSPRRRGGLPCVETSVTVVVGARPGPAEWAVLRASLRERCGSGGQPVVCDVSALGPPDLAALGGVARLQLTARRLGREIRLRGAGRQLAIP